MRTTIETAEAVRRKELTAREAVEEALARIELHNGELNAFVHVNAELALADADRVDAAIARGEDPGPLAGVPFGVKDLDHCAGLPTTHGSLLYKDAPPSDRDSVHIGRLRAAGGVPVGMTAIPEFGSTAFTRSKAWGTTRNPWNPECTPGGSSGGSASAVAAGLVPFATGGDGGGSIRIPGSYSGLVGFKASYGRIPREGARTAQTEVWGAMTTTVADAGRHLDVAAGPDDRDRTSLPPPGVRYEREIEALNVAGLRAAWSPDLGFAAVDPEVRALCEDAAAALIEAAGLTRVNHEVRLTDPIQPWFHANAIDFWLNLEEHHWPARAQDLVRTNRRGFEQSESLPLPVYANLLRARTTLEFEVAEIYRQVDVLLTPATATAAFAADGPPPTTIDGRDVHPAMAVPFTMIGNLCWNPAVSVPAGLTSAGLPVGLQIMGRRHADDVVLRLARLFEQARPWPRVAPAYADAAAA